MKKHSRLLTKLTATLAAAAFAPTCEAQVPADLILYNGFVYTVNPAQPHAEAVAIRNREIVFVGSDLDAEAFEGPGTATLNLAGRMAMPGAHDSHVHILEAFHPAGGTCVLQSGQSLSSYVPIIRQCAPNQIGTNWVLGVGHSIFDLHQAIEAGAVPKLFLDQAVPDRPVAIVEETSHSVWANSLALEAAGFTAATPDPPGGKILRDPATGEPNGVLLDAAGEIVMDLALSPSAALEQMNYDALLEGLAFANRHGLTSLADARCYWKRGYDDAWQRARDEGTLSVRAVVGLWAYPYVADDTQQLADLISLYSNEPASRLRFSQVKLYSDGEISHTTAALLAPYQPDPSLFAGTLAGSRGLNYFDEARLTRYVTELEAAGFDTHIHAIGDRGVHEALNAIEAADLANGGAYGGRHRLTHVSLVAPADVSRFAELDVTADFQPLPQQDFDFFYGIYLEPNIIPTESQRLRTLYDADARVVLSSDYDVGEISPFAGMQAALSLGNQSLPGVDAAIRAYTIDAAYLLRQEAAVGSIEPGKLADIIVLDQNITNVPISQIGRTQVLWTLVDGEEVWRAPQFCPPQPGDPQIRLDKRDSTSVEIGWSAEPFATQYEVSVSPISGTPVEGSFLPLASTPDTAYLLPAGAGGFFLVDAQNACGAAKR